MQNIQQTVLLEIIWYRQSVRQKKSENIAYWSLGEAHASSFPHGECEGRECEYVHLYGTKYCHDHNPMCTQPLAHNRCAVAVFQTPSQLVAMLFKSTRLFPSTVGAVRSPTARSQPGTGV